TVVCDVWHDRDLLSTPADDSRPAAADQKKAPPPARALLPDSPEFTPTKNIAVGAPPFPVDLQRVRPVDEQYWHQYRTTPKAFIPIETAQQLWQSRYGRLTSMRIGTNVDSDPASYFASLRQGLRRALVPAENGLSVNA